MSEQYEVAVSGAAADFIQDECGGAAYVFEVPFGGAFGRLDVAEIAPDERPFTRVEVGSARVYLADELSPETSGAILALRLRRLPSKHLTASWTRRLDWGDVVVGSIGSAF